MNRYWYYFRLFNAKKQFDLLFCNPDYSWRWWGRVYFQRDTTPPKIEHVRLVDWRLNYIMKKEK